MGEGRAEEGGRARRAPPASGPPTHTGSGMRRASCAQALNRGGPKRTTAFDASPVPVRKRPIGDDGRGRRGGGGGGGPARGCRARAPPPRPDPDANENGKGPRSQLEPPLGGARALGRPHLDGKAPPPQKREGPDERGCLCTVLPRGAKDAQPHRPSSSDGDALPPPALTGEEEGVVARREGGSREGRRGKERHGVDWC